MYAVLETGGKQYRVAPGDVIKLEKFSGTGKDHGKVHFNEGDILAVSPEAGKIATGGKGASVLGEIVDEGRSKKILVFHYKNKTRARKKNGHRQQFTTLMVDDVLGPGQQPKPKAAVAAPAEEAVDAAPKARRGRAAVEPAATTEAAPTDETTTDAEAEKPKRTRKKAE